MRSVLAAGLTLTMALPMLTLTASADEPYDVYNYKHLGEAVPSQAGDLA